MLSHFKELFSSGAVYYAVEGGCQFWVSGWNPKVWQFDWKVLRNYFLGEAVQTEIAHNRKVTLFIFLRSKIIPKSLRPRYNKRLATHGLFLGILWFCSVYVFN